jgi:hypothetical protein
MLSRRLRALLPNLVLAAGGLACVPLLLEAALRLSGYAPSAHAGPACIFDPARRVLLDCYPSNPRGDFDVDLRDPKTLERYRALRLKRLERAAARAPFAVEVRYNSLGFRGPEPGAPRPGVRRLCALGDSFTEGQGVREAATWPRVLERLLDQPGRAPVEVLNCARRASDFPELEGELHEVLGLQPDLVLYAMVLNDAERSPELRVRWRDLEDLISNRRQGDLAWDYERLSPLDSRLWALGLGRWRVARAHQESLRCYRDSYSDANRAGWERTQARIVSMAAATRARGARFVLALWPLLVGLEGRYPLEDVHAEIARFCRGAGLEFVDLLPALRGQASESLWVHPVDHHPNERAQRLVAEHLARRRLD